MTLNIITFQFLSGKRPRTKASEFSHHVFGPKFDR